MNQPPRYPADDTRRFRVDAGLADPFRHDGIDLKWTNCTLDQAKLFMFLNVLDGAPAQPVWAVSIDFDETLQAGERLIETTDDTIDWTTYNYRRDSYKYHSHAVTCRIGLAEYIGAGRHDRRRILFSLLLQGYRTLFPGAVPDAAGAIAQAAGTDGLSVHCRCTDERPSHDGRFTAEIRAFWQFDKVTLYVRINDRDTGASYSIPYYKSRGSHGHCIHNFAKDLTWRRDGRIRISSRANGCDIVLNPENPMFDFSGFNQVRANKFGDKFMERRSVDPIFRSHGQKMPRTIYLN